MEPHKLTSPEVGLLVLWLLSPSEVNGGGTVLASGSVKHVARALSKCDRTATAMHAADAKEGEQHVISNLLAQCTEFEPFLGDAVSWGPTLPWYTPTRPRKY